ncbi:sarcosine oxidase subunit gamma family protein [Mesorhizobium sp.]|uniref:sarcosine oxidase subunit gamma n=1 Tax=Mesorhizobium sp. TaxID=1871066 RepID=UPI0025F6AAD5|nr:sarcosine oxidase subunit gamma family protein [Mesorhizobium sp.]
MDEFDWTAMSSLRHALVPGTFGATTPEPGVCLSERTGHRLLQIMARRGRWAETAAVANRFYGVEPPARVAANFGKDITLVWSGLDQYLALLRADHWPVDAIRSAFGDAASVSEQTAGRCLVQLSGPHVRAVLAKVSSLDLHPDAFPIGAAAATSIDHTVVNLWRERNADDGSTVFYMLMFTSFAESIWHLILMAAAEYGCGIVIDR